MSHLRLVTYLLAGVKRFILVFVMLPHLCHKCDSYSILIKLNRMSVCLSVCRDALLKMKEVYEQSPQMGDADSLEPRLEEVKQILQKLDEDLKKNMVSICAHSLQDGQQSTDVEPCVDRCVVCGRASRCG